MGLFNAYDRNGKPVPKHLERVFAGRASLKRFIDKFGFMRASIVSESARNPSFQGLDFAALDKALNEVYDVLKNSMPAVICKCRHGCSICEGKRWLNAFDARRLINNEPSAISLGALNVVARLPSQEETRYAEQPCKSETMTIPSLQEGQLLSNSEQHSLETA